MAREYTPYGRALAEPIVFGSFMLLSTITMVLRIYVRKFVVKSFGLEDWVALLGWALFNVEGGLAIAGCFHGAGQHMDQIPPEFIPLALMTYWICELLYFLSNMAIKLSIALMLLRFVVEQSQTIVIIAVTSVLQLSSVIGFFLFVFQCKPSSYFWTRARGDVDGSCINPVTLVNTVYVYSVINCIWDWTMALLPWLMVRKLQLATRTKIMVAVILGLGSIASIATIVRLPYLRGLVNTKDFLYSSMDVGIWVVIEGGLCLVASSAATLKPLFRKKHSETNEMPKLVSSFGTEVNSSTQPTLIDEDERPTFGPHCKTYHCTITANGHICTAC